MIRVVRLGTPRAEGEGLRLGTVRRPPRGVKKQDYAKLDYYDVWLPELAPSAKLVGLAQSGKWTEFERKYRHEMKAAGHLLDALAALSHHTNLAVGCYCDDESHCHRSILRQLLADRGADIK